MRQRKRKGEERDIEIGRRGMSGGEGRGRGESKGKEMGERRITDVELVYIFPLN